MFHYSFEDLNVLWITLLISLFLLISIILVIFSCAYVRNFFVNLCKDRSRSQFKDYDNEGGFFNDISISTIPPVEFAMYPPAVNSFNATSSAVYFEPLPDILSRYKSQRKSMGLTNDSKLRPCIYRSNRLERQDSEDEIIDDVDDDTGKLERIFERNVSSFPRSQLQYIQEMGITQCGKVLQGEAQNLLPGYRKAKVAVAMLKEDADVRMKVIFLQQVAAFREISHNNLLKLYNQCIDTVPLLNILEYCPMGDLKSYLKIHRSNILESNKHDLLLSFACDMAAGLNALHQQSFIHRDFALRNCLLTQELIVKVGDYGLAQSMHREDYFVDADDCFIPIRWMAPETIQYSDNNVIVRTISKESNTWSFGVALWELLSLGELPYQKHSDEDVLQNVIVKRNIKLEKPNTNIEHINQMYELMEICWPQKGSPWPSIRELRIMILHLKSSTNQMDEKAFEQKWNQLIPRDNRENISVDSVPTMPSTDYSPTPSLTPFAGSIQASNSTRRSDSPMTTFSEFNQGSEGRGVQIVPPNNLSLAEELNFGGVKPFYGGIRQDMASTDDDDFEVVSISASGDRDIEADPADVFTQPPNSLPAPAVLANKVIVDVHRAAGEGTSSFGSPSLKSGDSFQIISSNEIDLMGDSNKKLQLSSTPVDSNLNEGLSSVEINTDHYFTSAENTGGFNSGQSAKLFSDKKDFSKTDSSIFTTALSDNSRSVEESNHKKNSSEKKVTDINSQSYNSREPQLFEKVDELNVDAEKKNLEGEKLLNESLEIGVDGFSEGFHGESLLQHDSYAHYLNTVAVDNDEISNV